MLYYDLFISLCVSKTKTNKIYTELFNAESITILL
jgi:hypothetical protein